MPTMRYPVMLFVSELWPSGGGGARGHHSISVNTAGGRRWRAEEGGGRTEEGEGRRAEDGESQRAEGRGWRADDRGQREEGGGR